MKVIVCLDDDLGMLFNGRRQSMDKALCDRVAHITKGKTLWMNNYSAGQFSDFPDNIIIDEYFLDRATEDDYCFVENRDISSYASKVNTVIIYRWNRNYPQDMRFPVSLFSDKWQLAGSFDFTGHSHDHITEEVYYL